MESHLLQMRGLKPYKKSHGTDLTQSHLLQMRGLKPNSCIVFGLWIGRIFYRCVD